MIVLIIYCAFTYGFELVKVVNVLNDKEQMQMLKYDAYPYVMLPYIGALLMFLFAPFTFACELVYNLYKIIKERSLWK